MQTGGTSMPTLHLGTKVSKLLPTGRRESALLRTAKSNGRSIDAGRCFIIETLVSDYYIPWRFSTSSTFSEVTCSVSSVTVFSTFSPFRNLIACRSPSAPGVA